MARSRFQYTCGHDGEAHGRNRRDADSRAAYYAKDECWDCRNAIRAKAAAEAAQAMALPPLTGTPKQISWAEQIRVKALVTWDMTRADILVHLRGGLSEKARSELTDALALLDSELHALTAASEWIDERDTVGGMDWAERQIRSRHLCPTIEAGDA
jgi:hypothetical protein